MADETDGETDEKAVETGNDAKLYARGTSS